MATTYTENYNLGMQTNTADKFDMSVITDNMPIIDEVLKANADNVAAVTPSLSSAEIDNTALAAVSSGTVCGLIAAEVLGTQMYGIVRAYTLESETPVLFQIAEGIDGTRKTRYNTSGSWSAWN